MKKLFRYVSEGTPAYVILHAKWRRSRGCKPSATLGKETNPAEALRVAKTTLREDGFRFLNTARTLTLGELAPVIIHLGLRLPTAEKLMTMLIKILWGEWDRIDRDPNGYFE